MVFGAIVCLGAPFAWGHDARPLSVSVYEQAGNVYRVRMHVPPSVDVINQPRLEWPEGCELPDVGSMGSPASRGAPQGLSGLVSCDAPLEGRTVGIRYELFNPSISTVARFVPMGGAARMNVLPPDLTEWEVPRVPTRLEVAADYMSMGTRHIWEGIDHLLFVIGLLLLARTGRRIFLVITGFTLAHSVTLSLSALGVLELAVAPTEAAIALSILFLAAELARPGPARLATRYPVLVSSSFGLLHGLGFAAALGEIGLPQGEIVTSLLFFNLGVEIGQILFILPFLMIVWVWSRTRRAGTAGGFPRARLVVSYGLGALAAFWFVQRLVVFVS